MAIRELEDYAWFPPLLRRYQVEIIGEIACRLGVYRCLIPALEHLVSGESNHHITDLCSGSGRPAVCLVGALTPPAPHLHFTDLYPQTIHLPDGSHVLSDRCDVLTLQPNSETIYIMLNAFHHFSDDQKKDICGRMLEQKSPFLFAEILEPGLYSMVSVIGASLAGTLLFTPFIRPFSWKRLFLTYVLPVNVLTVLTDGVLSVLRATNASRLARLFSSEQLEKAIIVERIFCFPVFVTVLRSRQ